MCLAFGVSVRVCRVCIYASSSCTEMRCWCEILESSPLFRVYGTGVSVPAGYFVSVTFSPSPNALEFGVVCRGYSNVVGGGLRRVQCISLTASQFELRRVLKFIRLDCV